jgi:hypothetical protein
MQINCPSAISLMAVITTLLLLSLKKDVTSATSALKKPVYKCIMRYGCMATQTLPRLSFSHAPLSSKAADVTPNFGRLIWLRHRISNNKDVYGS